MPYTSRTREAENLRIVSHYRLFCSLLLSVHRTLRARCTRLSVDFGIRIYSLSTAERFNTPLAFSLHSHVRRDIESS